MSGVLGGLIGSFPTPVTSAFDSIASATTTGSETSITFSSIPQTYSALQLRVMAKDGSGGYGYLLINNSNATKFAWHDLEGDGTAAAAYGVTPQSYAQILPGTPTASNTFGVTIVDIQDYASTTKNKTLRMFSGWDSNGTGKVFLYSALMPSTTAISRLDLYIGFSAITAGSTFALYGIKGA